MLAEPPQLPTLEFDSAGRAWEGAPGGQDSYNGQVAALAAGVGCGAVTHAFDATCSVPTVSALDLTQDPICADPAGPVRPGPFDDYAFSSENQPHLTITPECSVWLLAALGVPRGDAEGHGPCLAPGLRTRFDPHDPAFLADPYPTYASFRGAGADPIR